MLRIAVLDDWEHAAATDPVWRRLDGIATVEVHRRAITDTDELIDTLAGRDVVVAMRERTRFPAAVLERLGDLRLLVTTGAGNAAIDLTACRRLGITVCGTGSHPGGPAELTWALILAAARGFDTVLPATRAGAWPVMPGLALAGRTLGVLGLGTIGRTVAQVGAVFGMRVVTWSPRMTPERAAVVGADAVDRDTVFAAADLVTLHLPLTEVTRDAIGTHELDLLGPGGWLVNTSRAGLVDRSALLTALDSGGLAGAALDVFDIEPAPADDVLLRHPRVLATPHVGYVTDRGFARWDADVVADVLAWHAGAPIRVLT